MALGAPRAPSRGVAAAISGTIALSYTCSALAGAHTQVECGYHQAFALQYARELLLAVLSVVGLVAMGPPSREEARRMWRQQLAWALLLAPLALGDNVAFLVALRLTSTSSALALNQLTSLFIAGLSFLLLGARYSLYALPLLVAAVAGAILATVSDAGKTAAGVAPLQGDLLTLLVAAFAALYMVIFKVALPSLTPQEFLFFFVLKGLVTVAIGWIGVLAFNLLGWEEWTWPTGCAAVWLPVTAVLSALFNLSISWGTLAMSPLTARLSLLLGIPCSFLVDIISGKSKSVASWLGVALVLAGVVGFELVSAKKSPATLPSSGQEDASVSFVAADARRQDA